MSYRLIDSNDLAITYPEVNDMPCIYADLSHELDGKHYDLRDTDEVRAENAKLRELVSGLEYCVQGHICDCCPLYDQSGTNRRRCESLEHELGIEVPE